MPHISKNLTLHLKEQHNISPFSLYLREIVYGGTDGIITTFAVVAGFAGAEQSMMGSLPVLTVLIFGFANLFADGVSMGLGNFLATRSEHDVYKNEEGIEKKEVEQNIESEILETQEIFQQKGFSPEHARQLTAIISGNKKYWIDFMMQEELGLKNPEGERPERMAVATFISFISFGVIPLLPYIFYSDHQYILWFSITSTVCALLLLGYLRFRVTRQSVVRTLSESLLLGGLAAFVAYLVGSLFRL